MPAGTTYGTPVAVAGNPSNVLPVIQPDGSYTFTSPVPGEYVFQVPVCEPGQTSQCRMENLSITVLDPALPNPPVANTDIASTLMNTAVVLPSLANDFSGNSNANLDTATITIITNPKNGTATRSTTTGDITYTPNNNFAGIDTLYYRICHKSPATGCDTAMQIITILSPDAPNVTSAADDYDATSAGIPLAGKLQLCANPRIFWCI